MLSRGKIVVELAKSKAEYRNEYLSLPTDATTADCLPETDEEDSDADN